MKKLQYLLSALALATTLTLSAQTPLGTTCTQLPPAKNRLQATVDKIDNNNRDGVTRISCTLTGLPHTSSRVDSCTLIVDGRAYGSVDIDGVDFRRYFQWEDDGEIPVEIDFPRQKEFKPNDKIVIHSVGGDFSTRLGDKAR